MADSLRTETAAAASIQAQLDASRLRAHIACVPGTLLASVCVGLLMGWAMGADLPRPGLWLWWAALACVLALQLVLRQVAGRASAHGAALPVWLQWFRTAAILRGLVWAAAAWLPAALGDPGQQASLLALLLGVALGGMVLSQFDLRAGLGFSLPICVGLLWRLATVSVPLPMSTQVMLLVAAALMVNLVLTAQRSAQARRALALTRRAEHDSARGAREAESLLRQIFDHAGLGISVFGADLRLQAWNHLAVEQSAGVSANMHAGMALRDVVERLSQRGLFGPATAGRDAEVKTDQMLQAMGSGKAQVTRHLRSDGRLIELRNNPLPGGGFVLFQADITEREAAQVALAAQQRRLALLQEHTEQGFWTIDNDLRTTDANPAMCRMLGLSRAELMGRSIYDFVDTVNAALFRHQVRLRTQGHAEGYEITLTRGDGSQVNCFNNATPLLDAQGVKEGALGLFSDISAQKQAEQQLRHTSALLAQQTHVLEATLDSLEQGVLSVDASGRCNAWNRRFLDLVQVPEQLMRTSPTLDGLCVWQLEQQHFGPTLDQLDAVGRDAVLRFQQGERGALAARYERRRDDGVVLEVLTHFGNDGSLVRTYTDVTEARRAETALIAARDEAQRANRAKSDFLSRMSHELRTPMNAILGFGQLMEADVADPLSAGQHQRVQALLQGGRHLLVLIDEVLDVARIEAGKLHLHLQPVALAALAQACLDLVQPVAGARGVTLHWQAPADATLRVQADTTRLRQVLLNLLSNAIKFNRQGGTVQLCCRLQADGVLLEVADRGPGIAPEQVPRLFQLFERLDVDGAVEGTGIGLALSRSLMTLMHGEIGVRSTPGQGSVFWLRLPLAAGDAAVEAADTTAAAGALALRQRVLYVEDNEVNQVLMAGMLAHRPDIDLMMAPDGASALSMVAEATPALVLLDIQLPGMDGFEVLRRLRRLPALVDTPVIAVSANAMQSDVEDAYQAGFNAYVTKPVDLPRLLAQVDAALAAASQAAAALTTA